MKRSKILQIDTVKTLGLGEKLRFDDATDLDRIIRDNYRRLDPKWVADLKESIREGGVKTPVELFVEIGEDERRELTCFDGEHRLQAMIELRDEAALNDTIDRYYRIPVLVDVLTKAQAKARREAGAAVKNSVHKRENVLDRAAGVRRMKSSGKSHAVIAAELNVDRKSVDRLAAVAELPKAFEDVLYPLVGSVKESFVYQLARTNFQMRDAGSDERARERALTDQLRAAIGEGEEGKGATSLASTRPSTSAQEVAASKDPVRKKDRRPPVTRVARPRSSIPIDEIESVIRRLESDGGLLSTQAAQRLRQELKIAP